MYLQNITFIACQNHKEVPICQCRQNKICYSCGCGSGSIPCNCPPSIPLYKSFDEIMEEVLKDRAEAWEKLAKT